MKHIVAIAAIVLTSTTLLHGQRERTGQASSALQEDLKSAQRFQSEGNLDKAVNQYRVFLANALGELANARAHAGEYAKATSSFDQALALVPDSPILRLDYAQMALLNDDYSRAELLARAYLNDYPADHNAAQAHQILGRALLGMNRDQDAKKELEQAVALDPTFANGYNLAIACLDLDDEKCAVQLFNELQASFGDTAAIHMTFGRAYGNSDFAPRAVAEFRRAIVLNPNQHGVHYSLAAALLATSQDEKTMLEVEAELRKELSISPKDFLTYAALGNLTAKDHKYSEAEKYLKHAIALNPQSPDAYLYLGQMYFDTDRFTDAEPELRKAIQLATDESRNHYQIQKAHFLLGRILAQSHRSGEAHAQMQIARDFLNKGLSHDKSKLGGLLQENPEAAEASVNASNVNEDASSTIDPDAKRSLEQFEKLLTPPIAESYNNLGAMAASHGDLKAATGYFERAADWNPTLDGLDYNWGRAAFSASMFAEAVPPLSRYLSAHPDITGVRTALAMSLFMTGDYSESLATLQTAGAEIMAIPQMQYVYAESMVKTGEITLGKERLQQLEASHPEIPDVHRSLGEVFALQGDPQKAAGELHTALQLDPKDPEAQYDLGKVEVDSGNATAAIPQLELAVQLRPTDPEFHRELASAYREAWRPSDADKELQLYESLSSSKAQTTKTKQESNGSKIP